MPYDDEYPLVLEDESISEWQDRMNDEYPGMDSDVPF